MVKKKSVPLGKYTDEGLQIFWLSPLKAFLYQRKRGYSMKTALNTAYGTEVRKQRRSK